MSKLTQPMIKVVDWSTHHVDLTGIRTTVFMEEQGVSADDEWDGLDERAVHFLVCSGSGSSVGCARLLHEVIDGDERYHIGRVAILAPFRNQGIGHLLMQYIINYCCANGQSNVIYLHAQTQRRRFYETLGFVAEGAEFPDAGIPHIAMYRTH